MKLSHVQIWCIASIAVLAAGSALVQAQTDPVFTYQGQLKQGGQPFSGMMMMQFSLYDDPEFGTQIGSPYVSMPPVQVDNGLFTVEIDVTVFGPAAFDGNPRWLQIDVNDGGWITLSPRQPITPAPYALYAFDGAGCAIHLRDTGLEFRQMGGPGQARRHAHRRLPHHRADGRR